jgi:hypothetical protein
MRIKNELKQEKKILRSILDFTGVGELAFVEI